MNLILAVKNSSMAVLAMLYLMPSATMSAESPSKEQVAALDVVYRVYKDYAWEALGLDLNDSNALFGKDIANENKDVLQNYFTIELSTLLEKDANSKKRANGELGKLEFDPIFASQDPGAYNLKVHLLSSGNVQVLFTYPSDGTKIELEYKVSHEEKGWRISDIIYKSKGGFSLKKILQ